MIIIIISRIRKRRQLIIVIVIMMDPGGGGMVGPGPLSASVSANQGKQETFRVQLETGFLA